MSKLSEKQINLLYLGIGGNHIGHLRDDELF